MNLSLKNTFLLILAVAFTFLGNVFYWFFEKGYGGNPIKQYQEIVSGRLTQEIIKVEDEQNNIQESLNDNLNLWESDNTWQYPQVLYKNDSLIFWSNNEYIPSTSTLKSLIDNRLVRLANKNILVKKRKLKQGKNRYILFSYLVLNRFYTHPNEYLQSNFNTKIFGNIISSTQNTPKEGDIPIIGANGKNLFYVSLKSNSNVNSIQQARISLICFILAITFLFIHFLNIIFQHLRFHRFRRAILILILLLVATRNIIGILLSPFGLTNGSIFKSEMLSTNYTHSSLFSITLNAIFVLFALLVISFFFIRTRVFIGLPKLKSWVKSGISVALVLLSLGITACSIHAINFIYEDSMYRIGFSVDLDFNLTKTTLILYYLAVFGIYIISQQILIHTFLKLNPNKRIGASTLLYGAILGLILFFLTETFASFLIIGLIYFGFIYLSSFSKNYYLLGFKTIIYFLIASFCFSLIQITEIVNNEKEKNYIRKVTFGEKFLEENDILAEGLLADLQKQIQEDNIIKKLFNGSLFINEAVSQRVKNELLDIYFDNYDVKVYTFKPEEAVANTFEDSSNLLEEYRSYPTTHRHLYFKVNTDGYREKTYLLESTILTGKILVHLTEKVGDPNTLSQLFSNQNYSNPNINNFSYAIYNQSGTLQTVNGNFNYGNLFKKSFFQDQRLYEKSFVYKGYEHLALKSKNGRIIIVSQKEDSLTFALSNFSFLFLISIFGFTLLYLISVLVIPKNRFNLNFATKIQLYLNTAFLFPLLIISVLIISIIRETLSNVQEKSYIESSKNISNSIAPSVNRLINGEMSYEFFKTEIEKLAKVSNADLNIFDNKGKVYYSTRPLISNNQLVSNYMEPNAFKALLINQANETLIDQKIGNLEYKSTFWAIKDVKNKTVAVLAIPFFNSKTMLSIQVKEIFQTIIIIFLFVFFILLSLSYVASSQLTYPLKLITQRINRTSLDKLDEPIEWKSNDEIGVLTKAYNKMLVILKQSKYALQVSEKQSAWQELAKQVAHEIKNPLTPMKLTIQQLQRILNSNEPFAKQKVERALYSLTEQIDTISDITNSFSEFAKMPIPKNEKFDLVSTVQKAVFIFAQNSNVDLEFKTLRSNIFVNGDKHVVARIVNNLVLNGIQSVPPVRKPIIQIKVYLNQTRRFGVFEVRDNGSGIPLSIQNKIFIPNFSTKVGGSGLGLPMARRGIENAGGNIWFESVEDRGTTFYVDLPIIDE